MPFAGRCQRYAASTTGCPTYARKRSIGTYHRILSHGYHLAPVCDSRSRKTFDSRSPEPLTAAQPPFRRPSGRRTRFSHTVWMFLSAFSHESGSRTAAGTLWVYLNLCFKCMYVECTICLRACV